MLLELLFRGTSLATLVLVGLINSVSGERLDSQRQTLARRLNKLSAVLPKNYDPAIGPVHCGNSFGTKNPTGEREWVSCRDYESKSWYCPIDQCHIGTAQDTPSTAPLSKFVFEKCEGYPGSNHPVVDTTYVGSFVSHNVHGVSVVMGVAVASTSDAFVCRWQDPNDVNNARPWCNSCIYWEWNEPDLTPLLSMKPT